MAVDILGYKGQAELGYGAEGTPYIGDNSAGTGVVLKALNEVEQQGWRQNIMRYNQRVADRDETLKLASSQDIDVDIIDEDRKPLENKLKEIQDIYIANPDIKNNEKAYLGLKKAIDEFKDMKTSAKTRSVEIKKMKQDYATNPDPEYRQTLGEHIKKQVDEGIYHIPDPYQQIQDWDDSIFAHPEPVKKMGNPYEKDGLVFKNQIEETPLEDFFSFYTLSNMIEGANKNIPNKVGAFYKSSSTNEYFMSDKSILAINGKLDEINKRKGMTEENPYYLYPIATKDEDGKWIPTKDPTQVAMDVAILKNYKYESTNIADKDLQKAILTREQARTQVATQGLRKAQVQKELTAAQVNKSRVGLNNALAQKYNADAIKAQKDGDLIAAKALREKAAGAKPVDEVVNTFYNLNSSGQFKKSADYPKVNAALTTDVVNGLVPGQGTESGYEVAPVNISNTTAKKMLSQIAPPNKGKYTGIIEPTEIYFARSTDGDLNKTKLVGIMPDGSVKVVTPSEAVDKIIHHENGYIRSPTTVNHQSAARAVIMEAQGSEKEGIDLNAIVERKGIVNTETATPSNNVVPLDSKIRTGSNGPEVLVNGSWRKITGKSTKKGYIRYE